jgi:hypothetical protein
MAEYTMSRGDSATFTETIQPVNSLGQQVLSSNGITGWEFWLTLKWDWGDDDGAAVFQKIPSDWTITQPGDMVTPGIAFVNINPADTASLPGRTVKLKYDVQAKNAIGNIFTLESGTWTIVPDATRATS